MTYYLFGNKSTESSIESISYVLLAIIKLLPTVPKIRFSCIFRTSFPLIRSDDKDPDQRSIQVVMPGYVVHVQSLGEQIIDFAKIGISDNFRYPVPA